MTGYDHDEGSTASYGGGSVDGAVKETSPDTPVLIMSGETDQELVRTALQLGAAGYVPKTMRAATMLNALRLVLSGGRYIPDLAFQPEEPQASQRIASLESLTPRELEILKHLVKGLANKEIGRELGIAEVTVGLRLRSIYRKIGVKTRTQAVRLAIRQGIDS
ncbi:MAG TPA: response regulator transcription factor [Dongiaceae bacterium]